MSLKNYLKRFHPKVINKVFKRTKKYYLMGKLFYTNPHYLECQEKAFLERRKVPKRTEIINYILSLYDRNTTYLEIGVRNPDDNFNQIKASIKYAVDPGIEFEKNPVDFNLTSDEFFQKLDENKILANNNKFDVIFIDGLHLAEQVDRDIENSLKYLNKDGFIVLHDCNPPTEWHARYTFNYLNTPAHLDWNGTTWKAFMKWRFSPNFNSCCIDTDFGVGIICKSHPIGHGIEATNAFYEIQELIANRKELLNLISYDDFKHILNKNNFFS